MSRSQVTLTGFFVASFVLTLAVLFLLRLLAKVL